MKMKLPWQKKNKYINLSQLEKKLDDVMRPVKLRQEFVENLRNSLVGTPKQAKFALPKLESRSNLLLLGGLLSSLMIIFTGVRAVLALLGALGLIQLNKNIEKTGKHKPVAL